MAMVGGQALPALEVHTDGSVYSIGSRPNVGPPAAAGCAFVCRDSVSSEWLGQFFALGQQTDTRHVELLGIHFALQYLLKEHHAGGGRRFDRIVIFCDCQWALDDIAGAEDDILDGYKVHSVVLNEIAEALEILEDLWETPVRIAYAPGHAEIAGNEKADRGARMGTDRSRQGHDGLGWDFGAGNAGDRYRVMVPLD